MADRKGAGQLVELVAFEKRAVVDDGYGNESAGDFVEEFRQRAAFVFLRGSETVMAARLDSRQPAILRTRNSAQAGLVTTDWRVRDVRKGTVFNIRTITNDNSREMLELLVESGVASG